VFSAACSEVRGLMGSNPTCFGATGLAQNKLMEKWITPLGHTPSYCSRFTACYNTTGNKCVRTLQPPTMQQKCTDFYIKFQTKAFLRQSPDLHAEEGLGHPPDIPCQPPTLSLKLPALLFAQKQIFHSSLHQHMPSSDSFIGVECTIRELKRSLSR